MKQSAEIAAHMGAFEGYRDARCAGVDKPLKKDNVESMLGVIQPHRDAVEAIQPSEDFNYLKEEARTTLGPRALAKGEKHGYRNAQVTVLAPTGTIAFLMDCDTTGVEPDIALVKYKLLAGGGMLKIVNRSVPRALCAVSVTRRSSVEKIIAHVEKHDTIEDVTEDDGSIVASGLKPEHLAVFDCAFKAHRGKRSISYMAHLKMMGATQPFISGAISKTVNLPNEATVADIRNAYVRRLEDGPEVRRHLSRRLQALASRSTPRRPTKAATQRRHHDGSSQLDRVDRFALEPQLLKLRTGSHRAAQGSRQAACAAACPKRARPSPTSSTSRATKATSPSACSRTASPGELFITMAKEGSTIGGLMDSIGTLTSMALQYGVPLEAPREEVRAPTLRAERLHQEPGHPQRVAPSSTTCSAGWVASLWKAIANAPRRARRSRTCP